MEPQDLDLAITAWALRAERWQNRLPDCLFVINLKTCLDKLFLSKNLTASTIQGKFRDRLNSWLKAETSSDREIQAFACPDDCELDSLSTLKK
jgi:hypothetical protein